MRLSSVAHIFYLAIIYFRVSKIFAFKWKRIRNHYTAISGCHKRGVLRHVGLVTIVFPRISFRCANLHSGLVAVAAPQLNKFLKNVSTRRSGTTVAIQSGLLRRLAVTLTAIQFWTASQARSDAHGDPALDCFATSHLNYFFFLTDNVIASFSCTKCSLLSALIPSSTSSPPYFGLMLAFTFNNLIFPNVNSSITVE